ncbi:MAG: hypothetical protein KIG72_02865 [Bradymonadales bacterium]|nr:hypothetical protein [Bradymonadales bacterium]
MPRHKIDEMAPRRRRWSKIAPKSLMSFARALRPRLATQSEGNRYDGESQADP